MAYVESVGHVTDDVTLTQIDQNRDLVTFICKYLENGLRLMFGTNYPLTGKGILQIV